MAFGHTECKHLGSEGYGLRALGYEVFALALRPKGSGFVGQGLNWVLK